MYLIRKRGKASRAHIWTGQDTACRMYSTGGLRKDRFYLSEAPGDHPICQMCNCAGAPAPALAMPALSDE